MPLLNSLHPWMPDDLTQQSLCVAWVCAIVGYLNRAFTRDEYRADVDVVTEVGVLEELRERPAPPPADVQPITLADRYQAVVCDSGATLCPAGVVSFVSPRIKSDPKKRAAFVHRCMGLVGNATGLVVVDASPSGAPSPLSDLAAALGLRFSVPRLCAMSFRVVTFKSGNTDLHVWREELRVGSALPPIPFALRCGPVVPLDLEATYLRGTADLGIA